MVRTFGLLFWAHDDFNPVDRRRLLCPWTLGAVLTGLAMIAKCSDRGVFSNDTFAKS